MSGIDRLRAIAGAWEEWGLGGTLAEIADEIERERAEDCYRMGLDHGTVWRVAADMEHHVSGVEGAEDSPVARWARELRGALKSDTSDGRDVIMAALMSGELVGYVKPVTYRKSNSYRQYRISTGDLDAWMRSQPPAKEEA